MLICITKYLRTSVSAWDVRASISWQCFDLAKVLIRNCLVTAYNRFFYSKNVWQKNRPRSTAKHIRSQSWTTAPTSPGEKMEPQTFSESFKKSRAFLPANAKLRDDPLQWHCSINTAILNHCRNSIENSATSLALEPSIGSASINPSNIIPFPPLRQSPWAGSRCMHKAVKWKLDPPVAKPISYGY